MTTETEIAELTGCRAPFLIGIRHHSPAMSVATPRLLEGFAPDVLAVELPAEAAEWLDWLTHPEATAPLAMAFSRDGNLSFYPFADFSPELVALRWARANSVPVVCLDLPVAVPEPEEATEDFPGDSRGRDALFARARTNDPQEAWDRLVEAPAPGSAPEQLRVAALTHGWALRKAEGRIDAHTQAREERMNRVLGRELSAGSRVAAVVGSFHAAALLAPEPGPLDAVDGSDVAGCLVRYTFAQLDSRSGYPAGIRDPGWQQVVLASELAPDRLRDETTRLITEITRRLRAAGHPAGPGEAAETARVALDLAALRGLAAPSRRELIEAATTVLAQGEVLGRGRVVAEALEQVLIGDRSGRVAPGTPVSALRANVRAELEALRVPLEKNEQLYLEPLRNPRDLLRHVLLTRLFTGGITFASPVSQGLSRGAEMVGLSWDLRWSTATDASIELAAPRGLTPEQVAATVLLTRKVETPEEAIALLTEAAGCALDSAMGRALRLVVPLAGRVGFTDAVALSVTLAEVASSHIPGASLLPEQQRMRAAELRDEFTSAAVRELRGIRGSDDPEDAKALAVFVTQGGSHAMSLRHALERLAGDGSPLMQGAAAGLLLDDDSAGRVASWLDAPTPEARRALRRRLVGLLTTAFPRFDSSPATIALVDRVGAIPDDEFVSLLPALRGGFDVLPEQARKALLTDLARELGRARDLVLSPEETLAATRYDTAARDRLAALELADLAFPPAERWRLVLGTERERLSHQGRRMASALDELYGRPDSDSLDGARRGAGNGPSQLGVRQWQDEIEVLFGEHEVQEIFGRAAAKGRGDVVERLDPNSVRPSVDLLATALSLHGALPEARLAKLRPLVARLVKELGAELAIRLRPALSGLATGRPTRRRTGSLDLDRTIRGNLRHVVPLDGRPQVVPVHPVFHAPMARDIDWHLIVLVDVSGSMSESVVYSALTAAILAESPALSVDFLAFNTTVLDFTGHVHDPLALLLEVSAGGGTDIASALRVARSRVKVPSRTLLVLISDFEEFGSDAPMLAEVEALATSGATLLGCAALNDTGTGVYNAGIAARVAGAGMRVAAVSPLDLARWVGSVVREGSR